MDLVLAPFSSLLTIDAAKVTSKYGYALAAGSAGAPAVYALGLRSLFSTNVPASEQMVPLANYVASLPIGQRPATAAYPMIDDPFADPPVKTAKHILSRAGVRPVYTHALFSPTSSAAQLAQDAKAVAQSGAQMVVLGSVDVPTVQAFVKEFIAKGYNPKMLHRRGRAGPGASVPQRGRDRQRRRHHGAQRLVRRLPERAQPPDGAGLHRQVRRHRLGHQRGRGRVLLGGRGHRGRGCRHRTA